MPKDTLVTQEDLNSLLASLSGAEGALRPGRQGGADQIHEVRVHDFARSEALSRSTVQVMDAIYASFARAAALGLSADTHTPVHATLLSLEQFTWDQYVRSIPDPTIIAFVDISPLPGLGAFELNPSIGYWLIDRMLGGEGEILKTPRGLTPLERAVIEPPLSRLLREFCGAWQEYLPADFKLLEIASSAADARVAKPTDAVVAGFFEITTGPVSGMLSFCLPVISLKLAKIQPRDATPAAAGGAARADSSALARTVAEVAIICSTVLGVTTASAADIALLQPGDILLLETHLDDPALFLVGGKPKFHCRARPVNGRLAVEIIRRVA
jgi:flagellar motor switch protein FliM